MDGRIITVFPITWSRRDCMPFTVLSAGFLGGRCHLTARRSNPVLPSRANLPVDS